jgi:hypothetical protein
VFRETKEEEEEESEGEDMGIEKRRKQIIYKAKLIINLCFLKSIRLKQ